MNHELSKCVQFDLDKMVCWLLGNSHFLRYTDECKGNSRQSQMKPKQPCCFEHYDIMDIAKDVEANRNLYLTPVTIYR